MSITLPFLTAYDPPGTSEGTLDPLGLYQIADQLAIQLVPAVRERMLRIRFLTAMAVGALVTEDLEGNPQYRDASPYLVWEWLVVEAIVRSRGEDKEVWGVPGTLVTERAMREHGYLDARSYLKTARIFGFHGVYKRLAIHLGILDVHLGPGPNAESLAQAWARGLGLGGLQGARQLLDRWKAAVRRSLMEKPPRTKTNWSKSDWEELATAFAPAFAPKAAAAEERKLLREMLHAADDRRLGALPILWKLQAQYDDDDFREETLHEQLGQYEPAYQPLLSGIRAYERFARSMQDSFDVLRAEAAGPDSKGYVVTKIAQNKDFRQSIDKLHERFAAAHQALGEVNIAALSVQNIFSERFGPFAEPLDAGQCALNLCT